MFFVGCFLSLLRSNFSKSFFEGQLLWLVGVFVRFLW